MRKKLSAISLLLVLAGCNDQPQQEKMTRVGDKTFYIDKAGVIFEYKDNALVSIPVFYQKDLADKNYRLDGVIGDENLVANIDLAFINDQIFYSVIIVGRFENIELNKDPYLKYVYNTADPISFDELKDKSGIEEGQYKQRYEQELKRRIAVREKNEKISKKLDNIFDHYYSFTVNLTKSRFTLFQISLNSRSSYTRSITRNEVSAITFYGNERLQPSYFAMIKEAHMTWSKK